MIDITYLEQCKTRKESCIWFLRWVWERSQQAQRWGNEFYPVVKLTYNGHELDYQGTYGDVFFYLMKQDLTPTQTKGEENGSAITDTQHLKQKQKEDLVLVDFWATWWSCRMQAPILRKIIGRTFGRWVKILKMDVDENPRNSACFRHYVHPNLAL